MSEKVNALMHSFCEGTMGAAEMVYTASQDDARSRLHDARISELAFLVRRVSSVPLNADDATLLADVLAQAMDAHDSISRKYVEDKLKSLGRSPSKAAQLAAAILK